MHVVVVVEGEVEINYFLGLLLYCAQMEGQVGQRGSHGKLEKARENFNCHPFPLPPPPLYSRWRATLIKRGDSGQLAGLILKRRQRAPESPLIISLLL